MKVRFNADVLDDPTTFRILDGIVDYFIDKRHRWDIDDPITIEDSKWIKSEPNSRTSKSNIEIMQKCFTASIYETLHQNMHAISITVTNIKASTLDLSPTDARRCLSSPAYVLVENSDSDGSFLEAMMIALNRKKLIDAHTDAWWRYEHMGGYGEVEKRINELLASTVGPPRIFVIADSDRLTSKSVTATMNKITNSCTKYKIPFAILNKRKIENYIPSKILYKSTNVKTLRAFKVLSQEQRDYFEMKHGFDTDSNGNVIIPKEQLELFNGLNNHILKRLCGGFGTNISCLFAANRKDISEDSIRNMCPDDPFEIDRIISSIESLI